MADPFAPDWPVLQEWLRTGDCIAAVWEETDSTKEPYIGFVTYDYVLEGIYMRRRAWMQYATFGARTLPRASSASDSTKQFKTGRSQAPVFIPRRCIKKIEFLDPVVWAAWLKEEDEK